jgi:hypothetical protein
VARVEHRQPFFSTKKITPFFIIISDVIRMRIHTFPILEALLLIGLAYLSEL